MKLWLAAGTVATVGILAGVNAHAEHGLTPFVDPVEGAFRVGVPSGWQVQGGMVRYGPLSLAPVVQAMAPDGSMLIQLGDPALKDFASPRIGFPAGSIYRPGTSIFIVRNPETGPQFARSYSLALAGQLRCRDARVTQVDSVANPPGSAVGPGQTSTGIATFSCTSGERQLLGKVLATTRILNAPGAHGWSVTVLGSYIARADRAPEAEEIWAQMGKSYAVDPGWSRRESDIAAGSVRWAMRQWDANLDLTRKFDQQVIRGEVTVRDPTTGTTSEVPIGSGPYYFTDGLGRTINSPNPTPPLGFHPVSPQP
jgi:hypothetical protein